MKRRSTRRRPLGLIVVLMLLAPTLARAEPAQSHIEPADIAWMISATGLVLMMSIPGSCSILLRHGPQKKYSFNDGANTDLCVRRFDIVAGCLL